MSDATSPVEMASRLEMRATLHQSALDKCGPEQHPLILTQNAINLDRAAASLLRDMSEREKALREAIQGVLSDDDASTSLADQRARWPERMAALKRAMGE